MMTCEDVECPTASRPNAMLPSALHCKENSARAQPLHGLGQSSLTNGRATKSVRGRFSPRLSLQALASAKGVPRKSGQAIAWTPRDPAVATVTQSGIATGVSPGAATIEATSDGKLGERR
jgi:hypothetical protein